LQIATVTIMATTKKDLPTEEPRAVVIRMPRSLHDAIKAKAAKEERSVAQAMRFALRQYAEA
jgi:predicted HicB family RNase H-like nuclease